VGLHNYADCDAGLNGRAATTKLEVQQILNQTNFAAKAPYQEFGGGGRLINSRENKRTLGQPKVNQFMNSLID